MNLPIIFAFVFDAPGEMAAVWEVGLNVGFDRLLSEPTKLVQVSGSFCHGYDRNKPTRKSGIKFTFLYEVLDYFEDANMVFESFM